MMEKMTAQKVDALFDEGYHCSQVVFAHAAEILGIDVNFAKKISAGFGGGCFHGDTCGAVAGAVLAISCVYGFDQPDDDKDSLMVAKIHEFETAFKAKHNYTLCRQLLGGHDKSDFSAQAPEGTYCSCGSYCETACALLDEMLKAQNSGK